MATISGAELASSTARTPSSVTTPNGAPPTADSATANNTKFDYKSLCDALNAQEKQYVTEGKVTYANVYEIVFAGNLANAKLVLPGPKDKGGTATQSGAADAIAPEKNSAAINSKNISAAQGTQILQFIEQTVRESSYITGQQLESKDQTIPGDAPILTSISGTGNTTWFKILVSAQVISDEMDPKRNDYAYKLTYIVTPFQINEMVSDCFPPAKFRGVHKVYNYWFTGLNTQVISYEQSYNALYNIVAGRPNLASGIAALQSKNTDATNRVGKLDTQLGPYIKIPGPSNATTKGAPNDANTPAATAADFLYSASDQLKINVKIVGDPAWLLQGEILGLTVGSLTNSAFYPDGTICTETQQAVFAINFNSPADYNNGKSGPASGTGLVDINSAETNGNSNNLSKAGTQASAAYVATDVVSTFSKGRFEQTLTGSVLKNLNELQISKFVQRDTTKTNANANATANVTGARTPSISSNDPNNLATGGAGVKYNPVPASTTTPPNSATPVINRGTQPAAPAKPATSEGVPVGNKTVSTTSIDYAKFRENNPSASNQYNAYKTARTSELQIELVKTLSAKNPSWTPSRLASSAILQASYQAGLDADKKFSSQIQAAGAKTSSTTSTPITKTNPAQSAPKDQ